MSDNKNPNIRALGKLLRREQILCEAVRVSGGEDEDLDLIEKDSDLSSAIATIIVQASQKIKSVIRLTLPDVLSSWVTKPLEDAESQLVEREVVLDLVDFCEFGEVSVNGEAMLFRSKEKGDLAGGRAFRFLYNNHNRIPKDWRKFILVFPGTIWLGNLDLHNVQFLYWGGSGWCQDSRSLDCSFGHVCRVVRIRKAA